MHGDKNQLMATIFSTRIRENHDSAGWVAAFAARILSTLLMFCRAFGCRALRPCVAMGV